MFERREGNFCIRLRCFGSKNGKRNAKNSLSEATGAENLSKPAKKAKMSKRGGEMNGPPEDFMCPISLQLMIDPVILCTGQTYDRGSIQRWFESGKRTCPNTKALLADTTLIPNYALRSIIWQWAQAHGVDLKKPAADHPPRGPPAHAMPKESLEFLVRNLHKPPSSSLSSSASSLSSSVQARREAMRGIRTLTKENREARLRIVEGGAVARILPLLGCNDSQTEENAMVTLFYLSLDDDNKVGLVAEGALDSIVSALARGSMDTRSAAAVTLTSLAIVDVNKATIGSHCGAIQALVKLLAEGDSRAKKEATTALYSLCSYNDNKRRAVEAGAVPFLLGLICNGSLHANLERALGVLQMLSTVSEGRASIAHQRVMACLVRLLRQGSLRSREHVVAILSSLCCSSKQRACEAREAGAMEPCRVLLEEGTARTKRKAAALIKALEDSSRK